MHKKNQNRILIFVIALSLIAAVFSYEPVWKEISSYRPWLLGLDLSGGSYLIYDVDLQQINSTDQDSVLNGLKEVIEKRVNLFGVSEPKVLIIKTKEAQRLIVELAGIKDVKEALSEIGATPYLDFREVEEAQNEDKNASSTIAFLETNLNGRYVKGASLSFDNVTSKPVVNIEFNDDGAKIFGEVTEKNVGKPLAIFLDNKLIEMPVVREKIEGGKAQISGNFSIKEAKTFVERFNAGALPAPITLINQYTISPELGKDSLDNAIFAGILGTLFVLAFMLIYYEKFGVFAGAALLMYIALTLAIFKLIPITMTLAGIAGFILSIGMAVDANILVFERTKEEIKRGLPYNSAIEEGFRRAWTSIRDSNISTIITSLVLYYFTSSFVKGFAIALLTGVLISMFSAITITRTMMRVFIKKPEIKK